MMTLTYAKDETDLLGYVGQAMCGIKVDRLIDPDLIPFKQLQELFDNNMKITDRVTVIDAKPSYAQCVAALQGKCLALKKTLYTAAFNNGLILGEAKIFDYHCYERDETNDDPSPYLKPRPSYYPKFNPEDYHNPNFSDIPWSDPAYTPRYPRIKVPEFDWVINYIKDHWQEFTLGLTLAILTAVTVYFGGNAFLAFITGGASLPSLGATAPILAAVLVAILMKHGHLKNLPSDVPTASIEGLIFEMDEENNQLCFSGSVNQQQLDHACVDMNELQTLYFDIVQQMDVNKDLTAKDE
ncbi:MAG TPA: hypothetical protein PKB05_08865 [Oligoflexia bacterium]|nr:hypothetical protein [Oligoflexia bacterium]